MSSVATVLRLAYPRALATLSRISGAPDQAEDLLQDAATKALVHWARSGVPEYPEAWLVRTARNQAIDQFRRQALERRHAETVATSSPERWVEPDVDAIGLRDDMLRLVFICCHPVLSREARVALTLKAVVGLSVGEIARAFLVAPRTIEQRLTRAKRRIQEDKVPYELPSRRELPDRLESALAVVHLIFNEGHSASIDAPLIRHELCRLATGQAHLLHRLFPGEAEVEGLLALLLLTYARTPARVTSDGVPVPLDRQDRATWHRASIREGLALLDAALRRGRPGPYQIQAAIAATHDRAARWEDTDWGEIVQLYDALLSCAPSVVVQLNRAVAVAQLDGPEAGLQLLDALGHHKSLTDRHPFHAVRAGLLEALGRGHEALVAFQTARRKTVNPGEARYISDQIDRLQK